MYLFLANAYILLFIISDTVMNINLVDKGNKSKKLELGAVALVTVVALESGFLIIGRRALAFHIFKDLRLFNK